MTDFETRLKAGLDADDEAFLKDLENGDGLFTQLGATFTGPLGGWTIYAFIMTFVFMGIGIWAGIEMLNADSLKHVILWGVLAGWMVLSVALIKLWFWLRMNHLAVLRELKRIELRLVQAAD